jgi:hypothetical protein
MSKIVDEAKARVAADKKASKTQKTYTLGQIIKTIATSAILMAIGGYITLTVNNAINNTINHEVTSQVRSFTKE